MAPAAVQLILLRVDCQDIHECRKQIFKDCQMDRTLKRELLFYQGLVLKVLGYKGKKSYSGSKAYWATLLSVRVLTRLGRDSVFGSWYSNCCSSLYAE